MDNATIFSLALIPVMIIALVLLWRFFLQADRRELEQEEALRAEQQAKD
jgi:hypothetical protein